MGFKNIFPKFLGKSKDSDVEHRPMLAADHPEYATYEKIGADLLEKIKIQAEELKMHVDSGIFKSMELHP
jgi:hypothetical protein